MWMKCGDWNTKFFHATATQRQRQNMIKGLQGVNGQWHEEKGKIEEIILDYFTNIYSTEQPCDHEVKVEAMDVWITLEMNEALLEEFRDEEIRIALNQMHPTKSPDPDSMPPIFYQKYQDVVGPNVISCIMKSLNYGIKPYALNETYICLIPKVKCSQKVIEFCPINLCNAIYKIMSKVRTNRLKRILPEVIGEA